MHDLATASDETRPFVIRRLAFISAVAGLVSSFAGVAAPVPLYNTYRTEDMLSHAEISLAVVLYSAGTIASLLILGRLSNHIGRRPAAIASLSLLTLGCVLLFDLHGVGALLSGRLFMGFGAGLASSSLTAYIVDTAPPRPRWLASVASSQGTMLGLAVGAIGSGALVQFGPWPRHLVYLIVTIMLVGSAVLIALSPETVNRTPGAVRSLRPRVHLPPRVRPLVPVAAAVFLATWATGAFYQAFVPSIIEDQLHTRSPLIIGLAFASYMATSAFGAPLGGHFSPARAQRIGMVAFIVGMLGLTTAIGTGTLLLFMAATVLAGGGQGIAISAAVRGLLCGSTLADRAPIFSVVYLLSYSGAAFPSLLAGSLSDRISLPHIALAYGALALVATAYTLAAARNPHPSLDTVPQRSR